MFNWIQQQVRYLCLLMNIISLEFLLAAQGLPEFSGSEMNNLDNLPLGISRSVEGVRLRQVQEAELAKSITEISSVKASRVHLALPEKSVFVRDQTPPTASVFVNLKNGRKLDKTQILLLLIWYHLQYRV